MTTTATAAPALPRAYVIAYIATREVAVQMPTASLDAALESADAGIDGDWSTPHGAYRSGMVNALADTLIARDDA